MDPSDPLVLDRIGIVAHFFAAFFLAPELLGAQNLRRIEGVALRLDGVAASLRVKFFRLNSKVFKYSRRRRVFEVLRGVLLAVLLVYPSVDGPSTVMRWTTVILFAAGAIALTTHIRYEFTFTGSAFQGFRFLFIYVIMAVPLSTIGVTYLYLLTREGWSGLLLASALYFVSIFRMFSPREYGGPVWLTIVLLLVMTPVIATSLLYVSIIHISAAILHLAHKTVKFSQGNARGFIIFFGIMLFISGTLVQLWATFRSPI